MKKRLKIAGVVVITVFIITIIVGLAIGTIWLFHKGRNSDWATWTWICVLVDGIGTLIFTPLAICLSIEFAQDKIRRIKKQFD